MAKKKPKKKKFKQPPLGCRICKHFLNDDDFIEKYNTPYVCGYDDKINPKFAGFNCEEGEIGIWALVDYLKAEFNGIKNQINELINATPSKKQTNVFDLVQNMLTGENKELAQKLVGKRLKEQLEQKRIDVE